MWQVVPVVIRLDREVRVALTAFSPSLRCNRPYSSSSLPHRLFLAVLSPNHTGTPY